MQRDELHRMIRVDQAGEFGATRIYEGQLAVMGDRGPHSAEIRHMAEQEAEHRAKFDALLVRREIEVVEACAVPLPNMRPMKCRSPICGRVSLLKRFSLQNR